MKLVEFEDGTFGVLVHKDGEEKFLDLRTQDHEWKMGAKHFYDDCRSSEVQARAALTKLRLKQPMSYKVVDE